MIDSHMHAVGTVLVVDDAPEVHSLLRGVLERDGHTVLMADSGEMAVEMMGNDAPDVLLLDVELPGIDGLETARTIRRSADPFIIFLSGRSDEIDRICGLVAGGDDYITKPFSPQEVALRVQAVLRRRTQSAVNETAKAHAEHFTEPTQRVPNFSGEDLKCGDLILSRRLRSTTVDGQNVELTRLEFDILQLLLENAGRVVSRQEIFDTVWGRGWFGSRNVLDGHISNLRRKLGDSSTEPKYIIAVRGIGFRAGNGHGRVGKEL